MWIYISSLHYVLWADIITSITKVTLRSQGQGNLQPDYIIEEVYCTSV